MTMDSSLRNRSGMSRTRSVLSRDERIALMIEEEKFNKDGDSPLGLAKTRVHHSRAGHKAKKAAAEGVEGAAAPAAGAAAAPAAGGKAAPGAKATAKPGAGAKPGAKPAKGK